ncbi:MAG: CARDB domain-containing protein [Cyclobacteriaceae bacterium]
MGAVQYSAAALTPLNGTYTVGTGQTYTTINQAISAMRTNGISGPVIFQLASQTFNEQFVLPSISGSSATNTITFQSQTGNPADVILTFSATATATNYVAQLSNAAYVTFRNLTFQPAGTNFNRAIWAVNRATNLTFENLRITLPATTSVTEDRTAVLLRPTVSTNIRLLSSVITGGSHGFIHVGNGTVANYSAGTVITGNTISNVYARPMSLQYQNGVVFNDNVITGTSYFDYYGTVIWNGSGVLEMQRNRIVGGAGYALYLYYPNVGGSGLIANNFFSSTNSNSSYYTFFVQQGLVNTNIYHNSVNATGTSTNSTAFYFDRVASVGNRVVNNIFRANAGLAVEHRNTAWVNAVLESDHNDLFSSGPLLGQFGSTNAGTLEEWRAALGLDANSVFFDPQYTSDTNLTPAAPGIASAGKNLLGTIATDINNAPRTTTPSLGAVQYSAAALTPLSGTYTVGTGQTYTTINQAVNAMRTNGVSGPVIFQLASQTFNEQFVLPSISGSSATNTITFQSQTGNPADVILTFSATATATNYVAQLSNAAYVTFRNLTFQPAGTNFNRAIWAVNRATNITFENLRITLPTTTSITEDRAAILLRPTTSSNVRLLNTVITGGSHGFIHVGNSTVANYSAGTVITGNTISNVYARPMYLQYMNGVVFNDNVITGTSYSDYYGTVIWNCSGVLEMQRNRITGGAGYGVYLYYPNTVSGLIANNFFSSTNSNSSYITFYIQQGLVNTNIYHNSVNATGTSTNSTAFQFDRAVSVGNRVVNNIFRANTGMAVEHRNTTTVNSVLESDHNDLFSSGPLLGQFGSTNVGTLAAWRTASGLDANSLSIDPQFQSPTLLYTTVAALSASGKNVNAEVPDDIDGVARPSSPSIGAAQFGAVGTPLTGTYTIDAAGTGANNFTSFTAALDALRNAGVSGPVVFRVSGNFNEQITLLNVSGSSATNTITFESPTGNPADAIIRFSATTSSANFTVRLSNADHHRIRNMTIRAEGTSFARAVFMNNRALDILLEGNVIESTVTTLTSFDRGGVVINASVAEDVRLINNTIRLGAVGIDFQGPFARATGTVIRGNTIFQSYHRGIILNYHTAFILDQNVVTNNPSSSSFTGVSISNAEGAFRVTANRVTGGNGTALDVVTAQATAGAPALIANNFLQTNNAASFQTVSLNFLRHVNFYHNNINATGAGTGLYYTSGSGTNVNLINNIIKSNNYTLEVTSGSTAAIGQANYNNYFSTGSTLARWGGSDQSNLGALQAATGQNANSLSVDPQYPSATDLAAVAPSLAGAGFDLTAIVPNDINGAVRTVPVSIGATQFLPAVSRDGAITRIVAPVSSCSLTASTPVTVEISNLGATSISGFQVSYQINGGPAVTESIPVAVTILPAGKYEYTFTQRANLAAKQVYTIRGTIILAGDEDATNNQLDASVTHFPDLITTLTPNSTICAGEAITLTATGGTSYLWNTSSTSASITVSPVATTTYSVLITNANECSETKTVTVTVRDSPVISFTGATGFITSYVSPTQGGTAELFEFRMIYTDAGGSLPAAGYPRVELDANANGQATDPLDIIRVMTQADATDTNVTDGKEYRVTLTNLSDLIRWRSRIVARNADGCQSQTPFVSGPFVSNDLLDVAIFANDISFSKSNPAINESIRIYARVRNTSDYVAENFVVSAYIEGNRVFTQTVNLLGPQSAINLQWDQSFAASGFFPVKVVIDENNVLAEDNELNNFAIRPVIVGDYQLPGGIDCGASVTPTSVLPFGGITISGKAEYFGIAPGIDPDVAGATVTARITGGGQAGTTTQADGTYQLTLTAPGAPGTYTVTVEVTDFTLTGTQGPFSITVLPSPPRPDLTTSIVLSQSTILPGQSVSGTATVSNTGDAPATNFVFRFLNCDAVLGTQNIAQLNPGESLTVNFTTTTNVIGDCFNRSNCIFRSEADLTNTVVERSEANNQSSTSLTVLPNKPDLTPVNSSSGVSGAVNMLLPQTFSLRVDNIGGVNATTPFDVRVYMNGTLIHTEALTSLATCVGHTFAINYTFANTLDHVLDIRVDEPIGSGVVDEYRETNNEFSRTIRHTPPPPVFPNLSVSNADISVAPVLPPAGTNFNVNVTYRNTGSIPVNPPFDLELTVIEAGIPRIETRTVNTVLNAGATTTVSLTTSLATDGDHAFRIRLDNNGQVTEGSEGDNVAQMPLCVDFAVSPVGGVWGGGFYEGTVQNLTANIYNNGLFTATNVPVSFFIDNVKVASTTLPTVGPGLQAGSYFVSLPYLFATAGTFELKVVVDELAAYAECREDNNEFKKNIQVRLPAPDLRIFSEYIAPSKINPDVDEPITIFISYDNAGVGASGPFKARVLVDDVPLGPDVDIPSVAPGDDGTVQIMTPYRSSLAGIRVIRALLDPNDLLNETTRANNEASRALVVGQAPNLLFTNLQPGVVCPNNGDNISVTATVQNAGDIQATAQIHFFYLTPTDTIPIDVKGITVAGNQTASVQTDWLVINKDFALYAEIRNSDPVEFDDTDNSIRTDFCAGPYYNLLVEAVGQGLVQRTPNQNRFEGAQVVEITAVPAAGWIFSGWQGDATGAVNPLTVNLNSDKNIEALFIESVATPASVGGARCGPGSVTLTATGAVGAQTYAWYTQATGGTAIQNNPNPDFVSPSLSATTSYYVAIRSATIESPRTEVIATVNSIPTKPIINVVGSTTLCLAKQDSVRLQAPASFVDYVWTNSATTREIVVRDPGSFAVQVVNASGCLSEISEAIVVTAAENCTELIFYNAVSANDDVLNSYFRIENIDLSPETRNNRLKIFNRWGDLVFEARNYDNITNRFTGVSRKGEQLPVGTYFYVLEFDSGRPKAEGFISLKR